MPLSSDSFAELKKKKKLYAREAMFAVLEIFYMYFYLGGINMCKNHQIVQLRKVLSAHFNVCVCVYLLNHFSCV